MSLLFIVMVVILCHSRLPSSRVTSNWKIIRIPGSMFLALREGFNLRASYQKPKKHWQDRRTKTSDLNHQYWIQILGRNQVIKKKEIMVCWGWKWSQSLCGPPSWKSSKILTSTIPTNLSIISLLLQSPLVMSFPYLLLLLSTNLPLKTSAMLPLLSESKI